MNIRLNKTNLNIPGNKIINQKIINHNTAVKLKRNSKSLLVLAIVLTFEAFLLTGCGSDEKLTMSYGSITTNDRYTISDVGSQVEVPLFAGNLCTTDKDVTSNSSIIPENIFAAGVFDVQDKETLYSYQANMHVNPASLTKVMTALVVLQNSDLNAQVTIDDVTIYEDGVQLFGFHEGDVITLRDLLAVSLIYSGNDASLALAQYVGGTEEDFVTMMNDCAAQLGATNSHFANPHGLTDEDHYTTVYDLYLIFNAALQYDDFKTIINSANYSFTYQKADGEIVEKSVSTTNKYLTGEYAAPNQLAIWGGKTGSTSAAKKCLMVYALDSNNSPYICIVMGAEDEASLYATMTQLCEDVID